MWVASIVAVSLAAWAGSASAEDSADDDAPTVYMTPTLSCAEFHKRFSEIDDAHDDLLPDLELEPSKFSLSSGKLENVTNLRNVRAAIECDAEDKFRGLGASLLETGQADIARFAVLFQTVVMAISPELQSSEAARLQSRLVKESTDDSVKAEIRDGFRVGTADAELGHYRVSLTLGPDRASMHIDLRSQ